MALGVAGAAASPDVWVAALCVVVMGAGNGAVVCNGLLVQRGSPDALRGRVFTLIISVNGAVRGVAMAGAGVIVDHFGARWLWGGGAVALLVASLSGAALLAGAHQAGVAARPESARL